MKTYLTILASMCFVSADALFFVFVFINTGNRNIFCALLLTALVIHAVLLYKVYAYESIRKEDSQNTENFLFTKG